MSRPIQLLQPTLTAGELSPSLWGRVDIARYPTGLKQCRNFIVRPYGGVENRPGFEYCDGAADDTVRRIIPFTFSEGLAYVLWLGDGFVRFYYQGAEIAPVTVAWAVGTTFGLDDYTTHAGITYRSLQEGNTGHTPATSPTWWEPDTGLQISTPWLADDIWDLRYTQSADVVFFTHPSYQQRELRRTAANVFELALFVAKDGPFQDINSDEAIKVAASAVQGTVTIEANKDIFAVDHVGTLFYLETKDLGQVKPWIVGDRSVVVGTVRRSDGKTYRCTAVPAVGTWHETGPRQPIHESGRNWDGPGDDRSNGVSTYSVGVEWEYVDSGFGVVEITQFVDAQHVVGEVKKRLPAFVVGGIGSAVNTWTLSGDGVTKTFSIAAPDAGYGTYTVTIDGDGVQQDPNYTPPSSGGGGVIVEPCVSVDSYLPGHDGTAGSVAVGDILVLFDPETKAESTGRVVQASTHEAQLWRVVTVRGVSLVCSDSAPIPVRGGGYRNPPDLMGHLVPVCIDDVAMWDVVMDLQRLGMGMVRNITMEGPERVFWAGENPGQYIAHHNAKAAS